MSSLRSAKQHLLVEGSAVSEMATREEGSGERDARVWRTKGPMPHRATSGRMQERRQKKG